MDPFSSNTVAPLDIFLDDRNLNNIPGGGRERHSDQKREMIQNVKRERSKIRTLAAQSLRGVLGTIGRVMVFVLGLTFYCGFIDVTTQCNLGLAVWHSFQALCQLPSAMTASFSTVCDWTPSTPEQQGFYFLDECRSLLQVNRPITIGEATTVPAMKEMRHSVVPFTNHRLVSHPDDTTVIREMTTSTYQLGKPPFYQHAIQWYTGFSVYKPDVLRPASIFTNEMISGRCWRFAAGGQVALRFSHPANVSHISIEHIHAGKLSPQEILETPKDVSVWGLVDDVHNLPPSSSSGSIMLRKPVTFIQKKKSVLPSTLSHSSHFLHMGRFRYSAQATDPHQYFDIVHIVPIQTMVIEFETNQGNVDTTCVYSIGIYT